MIIGRRFMKNGGRAIKNDIMGVKNLRLSCGIAGRDCENPIMEA